MNKVAKKKKKGEKSFVLKSIFINFAQFVQTFMFFQRFICYDIFFIQALIGVKIPYGMNCK